MKYQGIQTDNKGYPICHTDGKICDVEHCRYFMDWFETGNCVLRIEREHTLPEIAMAFGISKQRIDQIIDRIIQKVIKKEGKNYDGGCELYNHSEDD